MLKRCQSPTSLIIWRLRVLTYTRPVFVEKFCVVILQKKSFPAYFVREINTSRLEGGVASAHMFSRSVSYSVCIFSCWESPAMTLGRPQRACMFARLYTCSLPVMHAFVCPKCLVFLPMSSCTLFFFQVGATEISKKVMLISNAYAFFVVRH